MAQFGNVVEWKIPLSDRIHVVKFEHGTTSGRRVIFVDDKEIKREDFMFKLVGSECFNIGKSVCKLSISTGMNSSYTYDLTVNGKPLDKFVECQSKILMCWLVRLDNRHKGDSQSVYRIILEKDTLDILVDGNIVETTGEFTENGTSTYFSFDDHTGRIDTFSSGNKHFGMVYQLFVDNVPYPDSKIDYDLNSELDVL